MVIEILSFLILLLIPLGIWKLSEIVFYLYLRFLRREEFQRRKQKAALKKLS